MDLQILVSTMHQEDYSLVERMNIKTDAIIINQCEKNDVNEFNYNDRKIKWMFFKERGVGLSRNNALMRANGDICLMADDDMIYTEDYEEIVINAFKDNPKADVILFDVPIYKKDGTIISKVKKNGRVSYHNCLKYGTVNIAFRREKILKSNICFSLLFGGGARYGSGEDTLFIIDCLKKGLNMYSNTSIIAKIYENQSTWFTGFNEKYFYDRGALFRAISKKTALLLALQFVIRKKNLYKENMSTKQALNYMLKGMKEFAGK